MKKLLTLIIAALLAVTACIGLTACGQDKDTLYVYTHSGFAPYEYVDEKGNLVGVDMDIMKKVGAELGYKVVFKDIDFGLIMTEIQGNKNAVGAAGMSKRSDRDEVAIASIEYAVSVQYVILPKNNTIEKSGEKVDLSALAGLKIGVQEGTTGFSLVKGAVENTDGALYGTDAGYTDYKNSILASLDMGSKVDAVIIDKLPAQSICNANQNLVCYELTEAPESYVYYFNKGNQELVDKVNKVLQKLIDDGFVTQATINHSNGSTD